MRLCTLGSLKSRSVCAFVRLLLPCNSSSSSSSSAKIRAVRNLSSIREIAGQISFRSRGSICATKKTHCCYSSFLLLFPAMIDESSRGQRARHRKREREKTCERLCVASFRGICTRADLSILITKTSEKGRNKRSCSEARERETA